MTSRGDNSDPIIESDTDKSTTYESLSKNVLITKDNFRRLSVTDSTFTLEGYDYPALDPDEYTRLLLDTTHSGRQLEISCTGVKDAKILKKIDDNYEAYLGYIFEFHDIFGKIIKDDEEDRKNVLKFITMTSRQTVKSARSTFRKFMMETEHACKTEIDAALTRDLKKLNIMMHHNINAIKKELESALDTDFKKKVWEQLNAVMQTSGPTGANQIEEENSAEVEVEEMAEFSRTDLRKAMELSFTPNYPRVWDLDERDQIQMLFEENEDYLKAANFETNQKDINGTLYAIIEVREENNKIKPKTGIKMPYKHMACLLVVSDELRQFAVEKGFMKKYKDDLSTENFCKAFDIEYNRGSQTLTMDMLQNEITDKMNFHNRKKAEKEERDRKRLGVKSEKSHEAENKKPLAPDSTKILNINSATKHSAAKTELPDPQASTKTLVERPNFSSVKSSRAMSEKSFSSGLTGTDAINAVIDNIIGANAECSDSFDYIVEQVDRFNLDDHIIDTENNGFALRKADELGCNLEMLCHDATEICEKIKTIPGMSQNQQRDMVRDLREARRTVTELSKSRKEFTLYVYETFINGIKSLTTSIDDEQKHIMVELIDGAKRVQHCLKNSLEVGTKHLTSVGATDARTSQGESGSYKVGNFTGEIGVSVKTLYEFLENFELMTNATQVSYVGKGKLLKTKLKDYAATVVPPSIENYKEIVKHLAAHYGGVEYILSTAISLHKKEKRIPSTVGAATKRDGWQTIAERAGNHLTIIRKVLNLEKHQAKINCEITATHSERYASTLCGVVPEEVAIKYINKCQSYPEKVCKEIIEEVSNLFEIAIKMEPSWVSKKEAKEAERTESKPDYDRNNKSWEFQKKKYSLSYDKRSDMRPKEKPRVVNTTTKGPDDKGGPPRKNNQVVKEDNEDCEMCKIAQELQLGNGYFKDHMKSRGRFNKVQCPIYLKLNIEDRRTIIKKGKLCPKCLKGMERDHECKVAPFSLCKICKDVRVENCKQHKKENQEKIDSKRHWYEKNNLKMVLQITAGTPNNFENEAAIRKSINFLEKTKCPQVKGMKEKERLLRDRERPLLLSRKELMEDPRVIKKVENNESLMIYGRIKGHDRALNFLYDTGANVSLVKDDVLGTQLRAHRTKEKVHIQNYSGGEVMQKWLVHLPVDEDRVIIAQTYAAKQEITLPKVMRNCSVVFNEAKQEIEEITGTDVSDVEVSDYVGGRLDGLFGMDMYEFFPTVVCSLSNGYTVFKSKLMPHSKKSEYLIGGSSNKMKPGTKVESVAMDLLNILERDGLPGLEELNINLVDPDLLGPFVNVTTRSGRRTTEDFPQQINEKKTTEDLLQQMNEEKIAEKQLHNKEKAKRQKERQDAINARDEDRKIKNEKLKTMSQKEKDDAKKERKMMKELEDSMNSLPVYLDEFEGERESPLEKLTRGVLNFRSRVNRETIYDINHLFEQMHYNPKCSHCMALDCPNCAKLDPFERTTMANHQDIFKVNQCLWLDKDNNFECKLPFKCKEEDIPKYLSSNPEMAKAQAKRALKKIEGQNDPKITEMLRFSFEKLVKAGYVSKFEDLTEDEKTLVDSKPIQLYIIWNIRFKLLSISTPARIIYNGSAPSGRSSLNELLIKGDLKGRLRFEGVAVWFCSNKYGVNADISKFFNNVKLRKDDWNFHQIFWSDTMDPEKEVERYIFKTCLYGIASSSILTETALERVAEAHKDDENLYLSLTNGRFVDDLFGAVGTEAEADALVQKWTETLGNHNMKIKGAAISGRPAPPEMADEDGIQSCCGYFYHSELDNLRVHVPALNFTSTHVRGMEVGGEDFHGETIEDLSRFVPLKLTPRIVLSKPSKVFDPRRLLGPYDINVKALMRVTRHYTALKMKSNADPKTIWDSEVPIELRDHWLKVFHDYIQGGKFIFPRFPHGNVETDQKTLFCFTDAATLGATQALYGGWVNKDTGLMETHLLQAKNEIHEIKIDQHKYIARLEMKSLSTGGALTKKCEHQVGGKEKVKDVYFFCDNKVASKWTQKDPSLLAETTRRQVAHFLHMVRKRFEVCGDINLYYIPSSMNISDHGTRLGVSMQDLSPESTWFNGPHFLQDVNKAIDDGILIHHSKITLSKNEEEALLDEMPGRKMPREYLMINNIMADCTPDPYDEVMMEEFEDKYAIDLEVEQEIEKHAWLDWESHEDEITED